MNYKTPHKTYFALLILSFFITGCTFFVQNSSWNTIIASIGAGGIASVCVAWLIDIRNTKIRALDNKEKAEELMQQFIQIYRRLFWVTANECYGHYEKVESRSFQEWLSLLSTIEPLCPKEGQMSMKTRCKHISANIEVLQRQIDIFRSQNATLVFAEFPNYEQTMKTLDTIWIHCWGLLMQLESENYKAFCETTYILYTDFINAFPQYKDHFPTKYSIHSIAS